MVVGQEFSNLDSSVVVHELELALNRDLQTEQLSVRGTKAELRVRVGRLQTSWSPPSPRVILLLLVPRRALLFWFFGGFRCGVPLFIVILVTY